MISPGSSSCRSVCQPGSLSRSHKFMFNHASAHSYVSRRLFEFRENPSRIRTKLIFTVALLNASLSDDSWLKPCSFFGLQKNKMCKSN